MRFKFVGMCVAVALGCLSAGVRAAAPAQMIRLSDNVVPLRYSLDLKILPDEPRFSGETHIDVMIVQPTSEIILHAQNMNVKSASVRVGNKVIAATFSVVDKSGTARLSLAQPAPAGKALILVRYDAPYNDGLDGLYKVVDDKRSYAFTQMETIGARKAFPGFDEPRFKTPYDVRITLRDNQLAVSNTPERKTEKLSGGLKRVTFATSKPLPTYLLAFAVGDLDIVRGPDVPPTKLRKEPIVLRGIATKGKGGQFKFALENTAPLLLALEEYFGIPYPYEKLDLLAVPDYAFGAMENAGAIVYREQLMLMNDQAPLRQRRSYGLVHAHEMAHQWFGDLVTPYWWNDIWLNEAFASWMEVKPAKLWHPDWQFDLDTQRAAYEAMETDAKLSTRKIREAILTEDDIANAFDGITYDKGAGVLNMVETYLGREEFRKGVQLHLKRHAHGNATSDEFFKSLAEGAGKPEMIDALKSFTDQPGLPVIDVSVSCGKKPGLTITQKRYTSLGITPPKQLWTIPVTMSVQTKGASKQIKALVTSESKTIPLTGCPETVMPDVGGNGYYHWTVSADQWRKLIAQAAKMSAPEALAIASNLDAAFAAGTSDAEQVFEASKALASHPSSVVALKLLPRLSWIRRNAPDVASKQKVEAFIRQTYGPLLANIGMDATSALDKSSPPEAELRRERLVNALAFSGREPTLRTELARRARLALASAKPMETTSLPRNILDAALAVLAEDDPTAIDLLLTKYQASRDGRERGTYLNALAHVQDEKQAIKVRALLKDKNTRGNEIEQLLGVRASRPETLRSGWVWFKQDIGDVMGQMADDRRSGLPFLANDFCSKEERDDVSAFFTPARLADMRGAARSLAQVLDEIDLCVRLKDKHMANAIGYLTKQGYRL